LDSTILPSILTTSFEKTLFPNFEIVPLMVTRPSRMNFSASLREQIPVELIYLFKLTDSCSLFSNKNVLNKNNNSLTIQSF